MLIIAAYAVGKQLLVLLERLVADGIDTHGIADGPHLHARGRAPGQGNRGQPPTQKSLKKKVHMELSYCGSIGSIQHQEKMSSVIGIVQFPVAWEPVLEADTPVDRWLAQGPNGGDFQIYYL